MSKRTNFKREALKSEPYTIRFPLTFVKDIKKRMGLTRGQQIANFLVDLYNQTLNPIPVVANPVLERNVERPKVQAVYHPNDQGGILIPSGEAKPKDVPARIAELEAAIKKGPPSDYSPLAKKNYLYDLKKELKQLKNE